MLFDYLENGATVIVMARYPLRTPVIDFLAPVFTFTKWVFVGGSFVVLSALLVAVGWRWIAQRLQ
jgi:membrane protein implicated in regulation of membrane protease activity